ncbi:MAG TPA: hypothetical protein VMU51_35300 [Mycobacteriales bacterium]|nr:hypothetical protein [Mycobacteriales bacterium]
MAQPRFLFVAGAGPAAPGWAHWPNETAVAGSVAVDGSWVAWRLAGGNNRELGRSAGVFADVATCREAALTLQQELSRARRVATVNDSTGLWGWRVELDAQPVAAAGRLYLRQRECQYSLTQFLAAVPAAKLTAHVVYLAREPSRPEPRARVPRPRSAPDRSPPDRPAADRSVAARALSQAMTGSL